MRAGLAARHVEFQSHILKLLVLRCQAILLSGERSTVHCKIVCHIISPYSIVSRDIPLYFDAIAGIHYIIYDSYKRNKHFL